MHENREISSTPWPEGQGRSAKATNRTADTHVLEKPDCAVVPVNQPNKGANALAEVGEGRAQMKENNDLHHRLIAIPSPAEIVPRLALHAKQLPRHLELMCAVP